MYAPVNFQVNEDTDRLITLMERAKKAGYNGVLVTDYKFGRIDGRPDGYYKNLHRTREAAGRIGLDIAACVMPVGYSNEILQNNPNLAEGIEVRDAPFIVRGGGATIAGEELLPGGAMEQAARDKPKGWDWIDGWGDSTSLDAGVKNGGRTSLRMTDFPRGNEGGNCRVVRAVAVRPRSQYHLSVWIKTQGVEGGEMRAMAIGKGGRILSYSNLGTAATQDWKLHHVVFNSLENEEVNVYIGIWGGRSGTIWIDEASLRQAGGVNMVRREGCPVRVTNGDGNMQFTEGTDFQKWEDPRTGREPYAGEYSVWHEEPPILILPGSRIREGDRLLISYYHTVTIHDGQVSACLVHDEVFDHMERQTRNIEKYLSPKFYFMSHDELRVAGQCGLCRHEGKTAGQRLAENVRRCTRIIRATNPKAGILVWSDMFDPHHNAVDNYYLVGSTLEGSWEGLDKSITIANWNHDKRAESFKFFDNRGHRQFVAGYYDSPEVEKNVAAWKAVGDVDGFIYTTWQNNYKDLERFAKAVLNPEP